MSKAMQASFLVTPRDVSYPSEQATLSPATLMEKVMTVAEMVAMGAAGTDVSFLEIKFFKQKEPIHLGFVYSIIGRVTEDKSITNAASQVTVFIQVNKEDLTDEDGVNRLCAEGKISFTYPHSEDDEDFIETVEELDFNTTIREDFESVL